MDELIDDLRHMTASWEMSPSQVLFRSALRLPLYPRLRVVIFYRASAWCWHHRLRPLALWLQSRSIRGRWIGDSPGGGPRARVRHHPHRRDRGGTRGGGR